MSPRKPKSWQPPPGLKIEVGVSRGDAYFKAEATPADALNVARMLTVLARQLTADAPDLLPHADCVPGAVIAYDWFEEMEGHAATEKKRKPGGLGFVK